MGWIHTYFPILLGWLLNNSKHPKTSKNHQGSVPSGSGNSGFDLTHFWVQILTGSNLRILNPVEPAWWYGCIWGVSMYHFNPFQVLPFSKAKIPVDELNFESTSPHFAKSFFCLLKLLCCHPHSVMIKLDKRNKVRNETAMLWAILHPQRIKHGHHFSPKLPIFHMSCNNTQLVVFPGNFHSLHP